MRWDGRLESLAELQWMLQRQINRMADHAKADIALMVARARGESPRYWRGMPLA